MKTRIVFITFFLVSLFSITTQAQEDQKCDTLKLRVMTYNLRFGELASLEELAYHIKSFKPDLVALQEVDSKTNRDRAPHQNGKDFITELAYHTQMFPLYGKTIDYSGGYYGIGILSRFPYIKSEKHLLPRPLKKEQRAVLIADIEVSDKDTITFASTHLDFFSADTQVLQLQEVLRRLNQSPFPKIVGGDFNAKPHSKAITEVINHWIPLTDDESTFAANGAPTSTTEKLSNKIDYLFADPDHNWKLIRTQAIYSTLSDHLPIVSDVELIRKRK